MRRRGVNHLESRIEEATNNIIVNPSAYKGKWNQLFDNDHPIYLEIGCGKGDFIIEMAKRNPDINFIAMEKYPSVLIRAHDKLEGEHLDNLYLVVADAANLLDLFIASEISHLYLNFSDPWPKKRHEKRRLTYEKFLKNYQIILKDKATIEFKTDNQGLFEYSVISFNQNHWSFLEMSVDLHRNNDDIVTSEYENKFMALGHPIYYLKVEVPHE